MRKGNGQVDLGLTLPNGKRLGRPSKQLQAGSEERVQGQFVGGAGLSATESERLCPLSPLTWAVPSMAGSEFAWFCS